MDNFLVEFSSQRRRDTAVEFLHSRNPNRYVYKSINSNAIESPLDVLEVAEMKARGEVYDDEVLVPFTDPDSWLNTERAMTDSPPPWASTKFSDVLRQVRAPEAWKQSRGEGVIIVIIDSGITKNVRELPFHKRLMGLCYAFDNGAWNDDRGHGSMSAYIATATTARGGRYNGIAPDASLISARTNFHLTDIYKLLDQLLAKIRAGNFDCPLVLNNSYGWPGCMAPTITPSHLAIRTLEEIIGAGVIVVSAAGNNHLAKCGFESRDTEPSTIWGPNSLDDVLCVGAVNWDGRNDVGEHAQSSRGPGQWARKRPKPDCVAPVYGEILWKESYLQLPWWGTSGAAPQVSGLAALVMSKAKTGIPAEEVRQAVLAGCRSLPGAHQNCVGRGMIDCEATLRMI